MSGRTVRVGVLLPRDDGSRALLSVECNISGSYSRGTREDPPEYPEVEPVRAWVDGTLADDESELEVPLPRPVFDLATLTEAEGERLAELVANPALDAANDEDASRLEEAHERRAEIAEDERWE